MPPESIALNEWNLRLHSNLLPMYQEIHPSSSGVELWTYGLPERDAAMHGDIPIHPSFTSRTMLGVIFGDDANTKDKESFLSAFRQKVVLVPGIEGLFIKTPAELWTKELQSQVEQYLPNSTLVYRLNITREVQHYEGIVTYIRTAGNLSPWSSASIAIDQVNLETSNHILSLPNLRKLTFLPPMDPMNFERDQHINKNTVKSLLRSFDTLRSMTLPLDFLADSSEILLSLMHHTNLTKLELGLPTTVNLFPLSTNEAERETTATALANTISSLRRLQSVSIPMEISSPNVIKAIGNLSHLKTFKVQPIGDMGGTTFLNIALMNGIPSSEGFRALRVLDVDARRTSESDLTRLTRRFSGVKIV